MKAIIVSDDVLSLEKVINSVDTIENAEIVKTFKCEKEAEKFVSINEVDVAFIDIASSVKEKTNLIKKIRNRQKNIFFILISDSKEDGYIAYTTRAIGFLLKSQDLLETTLEIKRAISDVPILNKKIEIKTFGNFSVLVNGRAIHFPIQKSREILAYLVNKQGTVVSWPTIAAEILDEDLYDKTIQNRLHRCVESLKTTLKENHIENILVTSKGFLSVDTTAFSCDLYNFLDGDQIARNHYFGEFMYEYSWANSRVAYLDKIANTKNF